MKKLFLKIKNKILDFIKWLWAECKDWRTILLMGVVCLVVGAPVWLLYLFSILFHWQWAFVTATVIWAFWMLPGAPYFAVCLSITLAIRRFSRRRKKLRAMKHAQKEDAQGADETKE